MGFTVGEDQLYLLLLILETWDYDCICTENKLVSEGFAWLPPMGLSSSAIPKGRRSARHPGDETSKDNPLLSSFRVSASVRMLGFYFVFRRLLSLLSNSIESRSLLGELHRILPYGTRAH